MRVYLDTEFADWDDPNTDLISLALVADDGREFYAECTDLDLRKCTAFVRREVLPLLGAPSVARLDSASLKRSVLAWLAEVPQVEIAVDYDGDWHLFARLLGNDMPADMTVTNIYKAMDKDKLAAYYRQPGVIRHHALHDARANRVARIE